MSVPGDRVDENGLLLNPVILISEMESELEDIRRLALVRGRHYRTAIGRLDNLEDAMLGLFEARLDLMDDLIGSGRPTNVAEAASNQSVSARTSNRRLPPLMTAIAEMRDLEENLELMKARVRFLQRRVDNLRSLRSLGFSEEMRSFIHDESRNEPVSEDAEIIRRELERFVQRDGKHVEDQQGGASGAQISILEANDQNQLANRDVRLVPSRRSYRISNKRSKFTC